jgi:endonuclease YncB( thermonuclease family)
MTIIRWLIAGLVVIASCGTGRCDELVGQSSVIDGDTLEIHGTRIRLLGIDAPESTHRGYIGPVYGLMAAHPTARMTGTRIH